MTDTTDTVRASEALENLTLLIAEVEAGNFDQIDAVADKWAASVGVVRMMNAVASVFEKHASQEIMDRFRTKLNDLMHLSFVEGAAQGVLQFAPVIATPPIQTGALVDALECVREHFDGVRRDKDWFETERVVRATLTQIQNAQPIPEKYAAMSIDERANAMADDCAGDPWELIGFFREKLRQSEANADSAKSAAIEYAKRFAALPSIGEAQSDQPVPATHDGQMASIKKCNSDGTTDFHRGSRTERQQALARMTALDDEMGLPDEPVGVNQPVPATEAGEVERLREALASSMTAIDDWLHTYAAELCHQSDVDASARRIGQFGTLAYIARVQDGNRAALATHPATSQGEAQSDYVMVPPSVPEGFVARECGYSHPVGTRCPACADWPYKKGGAAAYQAAASPSPAQSDGEML